MSLCALAVLTNYLKCVGGEHASKATVTLRGTLKCRKGPSFRFSWLLPTVFHSGTDGLGFIHVRIYLHSEQGNIGGRKNILRANRMSFVLYSALSHAFSEGCV